MKNSLIIGIATLALTGSALFASSMYAATPSGNALAKTSVRQMRHNPEAFLITLSGEVSPASYNATKALFDEEKVKMDALKNGTVKLDQATMKAQFDAMQTKVDALIVQYPELKGKIPTPRHGSKIESVLATLPTAIQDQLKGIRDSYKIKMDALRTAEKSEIDTALAAYPDVKAKVDALQRE